MRLVVLRRDLRELRDQKIAHPGNDQRLRDTAAQLHTKIIDACTKEDLLRSALNAQDDVEAFLLPQAIKVETGSCAAMWFTLADFQLIGTAPNQTCDGHDGKLRNVSSIDPLKHAAILTPPG